MDAERDRNAPRPEISAHVGSCVLRVRELDPSMKFYCDVFSCNVAVRETDMALLVAPNGFHICLHPSSRRRREANTAGVQYLLWATDTETDLQEFAQRLRAYDPAVFSRTGNGVTAIEGPDPDGGRVLHRLPESLSAPTCRDSSAPARSTVRPEQVASTGSILPPTAAA